jgi:UDP-N-acetylglucosamine 3-dehydrogenase
MSDREYKRELGDDEMRKLNVAVVGAGFWGKNHVRVFSNMHQANLLAVCDTDERRAKDISGKYHVQSFTKVEKLVNAKEIDALSICTPTTTHFSIGRRALEQGKHVLIEKPMVSTSEEAQQLVTLAANQGLHIMVGFIERFNPGVQRVKTFIRNGDLGKVILAFSKRVGRWPERIGDVGVVKDTAIHDIDLMRFIFEQDPQRIYARMGSLNHKFEDYCHIVLSFTGLQTGFVEANWLTPRKIRALTVTGGEAVATLNYLTQELVIEDVNKMIKPSHTWEEPLALELQEFVSSILHDRPPSITGLDGLKALEIAEAAMTSGRTNAPVDMDAGT